MMENCDVLIVGGGPSGATCAWKLKQAGVDAIVLDRCQFPRNKVCAGWITPPVIDELKFSVEEYQPHGIIQPITRFMTGLIGGSTLETDYGHVVSYGIRRIEFDDFLLRRSNARLRLAEPFHSMRQENGNWIVNESIRSRFVVGAGGHFCPVARMLRAQKPLESVDLADTSTKQPTVVAQEVEFEMTEAQQRQCRVLPDRPELYFCRDLKGYGWVFRKGNYLNIGLGREGETELSRHVSEFVQSLVSLNRLSAELPSKFHGHAYRLRTALAEQPNEPNVLLIGDSAGLADCHSGEGIRPAIESGLLAAQCLVETNDHNSKELGAIYTSRICQRFDVPHRSEVLNWIPTFVRQAAARWLMRSAVFSRHVVLDRWFLHRDQSSISV